MCSTPKLSIGLFATQQRPSALLRALLSLTGYPVYCPKQKSDSLDQFLLALLEASEHTGKRPYDVLILQVATTELVGHTRAHLEQVIAKVSLPIVLLTSAQEVESLPANMIAIPLYFGGLLHALDLFAALALATGIDVPLTAPLLQEVLHMQRVHIQEVIQSERTWITRRIVRATQRQEWIEQRRQWLHTRLTWIERQRQRLDPQQDWLDEQQIWVQQQLAELAQQERWLHDHTRFLHIQERRLVKLEQQGSWNQAQLP